jgi:hypothetical protein
VLVFGSADFSAGVVVKGMGSPSERYFLKLLDVFCRAMDGNGQVLFWHSEEDTVAGCA